MPKSQISIKDGEVVGGKEWVFRDKGFSMDRNICFDRSASARRVDENGYLHVAGSHITKATVNPYYGAEIPGWEAAGLDPQKVYYGFRDPQELQKSLSTWAGLPLHIEHHVDSADDPQKLTRVGSVGTDVRWNAPYVDAPLTVWDRQAITGIEDGSFRELSCAYRYTPDFTPGEYEGTPYDFVMRDIRGNHVALVEEGRAGPDVVVADRQTVNNPQPQPHGGIMQGIRKLFRGAQDGDPAVERQEVDLAQAIIDLHKLDPRTGEILDITEDEDKEKEIRYLLNEMAGKIPPDQLKKLRDALTDLAYSKPTGDEAGSEEFAAGVKYGEELERDPAERRKLDREHESEGMKKAMDACGLDAEDPATARAFAEGVKYGEKMEKKEPEKLDREHESEGERKALGEDEDAEKAEETAQDRAMRRGPRPLTAADAQRIRAEAAADARDHLQALYRAVDKVRPLVGQLDALSFDSARDVYEYTLKGCGMNPAAYPRASWRGMVDVLLNQRRDNIAAGVMAQDAGLPGRMDGAFAGLNNIVLS